MYTFVSGVKKSHIQERLRYFSGEISFSSIVEPVGMKTQYCIAKTYPPS